MFNENFYKIYKKVLVLGTGGGNDIASATLAASYLTNRGVECDVAGILSPGAIHYFDGQLEKIVNLISNNTLRFIGSKKPTKISFMDAILPEEAKKTGYQIGKFYEFSLQQGTRRLLDEVNLLISENNYDLLLGVDVGGDILGRVGKDKTLLSPQMDFSTLNLLGRVKIDSYLCEFGLGTDGELRPEGIGEILREMRDKDILLSEGKISSKDPEIEQFERLFEQIAKVRRGHTQVITLETLRANPLEDLVKKYRSRYHLGDKVLENNFEITIPNETFGKTFLLDSKKLALNRQDTAFDYETPFEQFLKLKVSAPEWKTEMDLSYTSFAGKNIYLLTPSTTLPRNLRQEILVSGEDNLLKGLTDFAVILKEDKDKLGKDLFKNPVGNFVLVSALPTRNANLEKQVGGII